MKIFICCSKRFYERVLPIKTYLEFLGHIITSPNSYDNPLKEEEMRLRGEIVHAAWKAEMFRLQEKKIRENDAILVLNFEKDGQENYIGGATFLEIFKAWELGRRIFLLNPVPEGCFKDELLGMSPIVLNHALSLIPE